MRTEAGSPGRGGRPLRRRTRIEGRTAGRTVAALIITVALTACGSTSPHAASHASTTPKASGSQSTSPTTSANHKTPASLLPTLDRALREENSKQYAAAVADFLTVVKADPSNQIAWYDLGVIAALHSETAQAIRDYQAAINGDPTYVPALYNLATLEATAHPAVAMGLYQRVIKIEPGNAAAHLNLGFALESLGRTTSAKAQFVTAIRLEPALASRVPVADGGTA
jgi:tetratricopeptide (TPR) repeat protein